MRKYELDSEIRSKLRLLGQIIKEYRVYSFLSRMDINELYGFPRSLVERIEYGENITLNTLFRISDILEITLSDIFKEIEEKISKNNTKTR